MKSKKLIVSLMMFLVPLVSTPLVTQVTHAATPKNALVIADAIDDLISLDPAEMFEFSGLEYTGNSYDRLVEYDVDDVTKIYGKVAESWDISDDRKTLTFTIRPGITFASGNPLTADDVVFSLQRVVKLNKSPAFIITQFGLNADNVEEKIVLIDDMTFSIELDKPYASSFVLYCLTSGVASVVDKKLVLEHEQDGDYGNGWLRTNYAGSGPLVLKSWKPNESLSLVANKNYWNGAPSLDNFFIRHVPESSVQRLLLEKGDVDIAKKLEADQLEGIKDNNDIYVTTRPKGAVYYLGLNQKNEFLSIPEVRQAMKYLIDYAGMEATIIKGRGVTHQAFLPVGFLGALEETPYSYNVEKAKELLASVGLEEGFNVTMDTRNTTLVMDLAKAIQTTLGKANISLEIIPGDNKQTLTKYRARTHDIYIGRWGPDYQDPHTNAGAFAANEDNSDNAASKPLTWRNSWMPGEMTEVVNNATLEGDASVREATYLEVQREHQMVSPFIIMFQEIENVSFRNNIENYIQGPSSDTNFYYGVTKQ